MIHSDALVGAGLPMLPQIIPVAMKAANIAAAQGISKETILEVVASLSRDASSKIPDGLESYFVPLADALAACPDICAASQRRYQKRDTPAPWMCWGAEDIDEISVQQKEQACSLPVSVGGALLPDAHAGYGLPIGGVLAVRNAVIPYAVGKDIACRMRITVLDIPPSRLDEHEESFIEALEKETRFGIGANFASGERRSHPIMDEDWSVSPVTQRGKDKAYAQLGSSGSGNHFVEFGVLTVPHDIDEQGFKLSSGQWLALLSHSGSRNLGENVASHYSDLALSLHPELPKILEKLAWLDLDSESGMEYWNAMQLMGRYAAANHELIHRHVLAALGAQAVATLENHHNFAWWEEYDGEILVIHRKGATPAALGCLGIVPGSMATPGFVVRGKGNKASYCSCSHGSGRRMSRKAAFQAFTRQDMHALLAERKVHLLSGGLDESPQAYKDSRTVISAQGDLIDVLAEFEPRLVKMAPEMRKPFQKKKATECE